MTVDVDALERTLAETRDVFGSLTAEEWAAPSACAGWSVQTTFAHVTVTVASIAGLDAAPLDGADLDFEAAVDAQAQMYSKRTPTELLEVFEAAAPAVVGLFRSLPEDVLATPVPMGSAGSYTLGQLADAIVFDETCHLHWDVVAPRGPVARRLPPVDEGRMAATMRWLLAGIPQMTDQGFHATLTEPVGFDLTGPGATSFTVRADPDGVAVSDGIDPAVRATVASTTTDFVLWGTGRTVRNGRAQLDGDVTYGTAVLDAFRVY